MGQGGNLSPGFGNLNFAISFLVEKCFSLSFRVDEMKFHHYFPWKNPLLSPPLEIILATPMLLVLSIPCCSDPAARWQSNELFKPQQA